MGCRELQYYFRDGVSSDYHRASGSISNRFAFRFSSEVFDTETSLVYYNYRYYSPELGRWLSRDLMEEFGGLNLFSLYINPGALLNSDPLTAINTLIHEPQHDFSQRGMGHDAIRIYNVDESGNIIDADDSNEDTYQQYVVENWSNRINDALRLAAAAASITPTNGCCVTEPNKDKEINNKLQSIYCKCGQQY